MNVNIAINLKQGVQAQSKVDRLAMFMNESIHGPEENNKLYSGVYTIPYTQYVGKAEENNGKTLDAYFDQMIDGKPNVFSWRFWGKNAHVILEFLEKENQTT